MLRLAEITEDNWLEVRRLTVSKAQEGFLDSALGIMARGYVYRSCRAKVLASASISPGSRSISARKRAIAAGRAS